MRISVLGSGAWGTAFGLALASDKSTQVVFWSRNKALAETAATGRSQSFPELSVVACGETADSIKTAVSGADLVIIAVAKNGFEEVLRQLPPKPPPVVWISKGFNDKGPLCITATAVLGEKGRFAVLSGPSFAEEVMRGLPTALTLAANHQSDCEQLQEQLHRPMLRIYKNPDIIGVCVTGALKNIIAIAAGVCDGIGLGYNARAALITRSLAEIAALNRSMGGKDETLTDLCGIGDLLLSCTSDLSRNRRLGLSIGTTAALVDITETCEGASSVESVLAHAKANGVDMPISEAVGGLLRGDFSPQTAIRKILERKIKK